MHVFDLWMHAWNYGCMSDVGFKSWRHSDFNIYIFKLINYTLQVEYNLITLDHIQQVARLSLVGPSLLETLQKPEIEDPQ